MTIRDVPNWVVMLIPVPIILVAMLFAVENAAKQRARSEMWVGLKGLSQSYRVLLNDQEVADGARIIAALNRAGNMQAHHSHPLEPIRIQVSDGRRVVNIIMARDSEKPDEYWVFRPGARNIFGDPLGQEIGRVTDPTLTAYFAQYGF